MQEPKKTNWIIKILAFIGAGLIIGATTGLAFWGTMKLTGAGQKIKEAMRGLTPQAAASSEVLPGAESPAAETQAASTDQKKADNQVRFNKGQSSQPIASIGNDVTAVVDKCMPSVVTISAMTEIELSSWFNFGTTQKYEVPSSGSGILIGEDDDEYLIVTNNHVVEDANELTVAFIDETTASAQVKGKDSEYDVAVIAVKKTDVSEETKSKIDIAEIGDSNSLKVGQGVVAIGNALGYGQSVTVGYISALDREFEAAGGSTKKLIQTDAAINPGNSGGALLNMAGQVIGINEAKYASTEVEGMGYAIPISTVTDLIEDFSNQEVREKVAEEEQGYLGIQGQSIDASMAEAYDMPQGAYVYKILEGTGAEASSLQEKDIIVKVDHQSVKSMEELRDIISKYRAGETVELTIKRLEGSEYQDKTISITLGERPKEDTEKQ